MWLLETCSPSHPWHTDSVHPSAGVIDHLLGSAGFVVLEGRRLAELVDGLGSTESDDLARGLDYQGKGCYQASYTLHLCLSTLKHSLTIQPGTGV